MTQNFFGHNPMKRFLYPLYFPDVSPSEFYLFRKVKHSLIGQEIPDEIDLLEVATQISNGIPDTELHRVFRNWVEDVERVIGAGGDYSTE
jgi:hypothetical protein